MISAPTEPLSTLVTGEDSEPGEPANVGGALELSRVAFFRDGKLMSEGKEEERYLHRDTRNKLEGELHTYIMYRIITVFSFLYFSAYCKNSAVSSPHRRGWRYKPLFTSIFFNTTIRVAKGTLSGVLSADPAQPYVRIFRPLQFPFFKLTHLIIALFVAHLSRKYVPQITIHLNPHLGTNR